ncbi:MAG: winged helix family transcriptional regulator [Microvirga sp.]|nr:winged helix family transcriptional regulator [Microvirga sp.]
MDESARIEALEAENERLQLRVEQLEGLMGMSIDALVPIEWRLTRSEACVFGVLLRREIATKDAVMAALYRSTAKDEAELKIVDVFICKMRKKLRPFGITIITRWGTGYSLEDRTALAARLGAAT